MPLFLRALLFTLLAPGTVLVAIPYALLALRLEILGFDAGRVRWLGAGLIAAGCAVYLRCAWDFVSAGRGTPAPWDAPRKLVVRGLYRYSRNPMYVGVVSVLVGEALAFGSTTLLLWAAFMLTVFHLAVVHYEEPRLAKQFGADYDACRRAVRRWLGRRGSG